MTIKVKNKDTLIYDEFEFRCCVGKNGFTKKKIEGDKKTNKKPFFNQINHFKYTRVAL